MHTDNTMKILSIDIGGSHIKATVLNIDGTFFQEYERLQTPVPATPGKVLDVIKELSNRFHSYDRVAAGFPGFVKDGIVKTAPNLGTKQWVDFNLQQKLQQLLARPALVINDADLQGISVASGKGLEMMITLGTGFGTAILNNGMLIPHLELAHHPVSGKKDYDQYIGEAELIRIGEKKWNKRMKKVIEILKTVFNYDRLYISGGNAKLLSFKLDDNIAVVGNKDGIKGGARLWIQQNIIENQKILSEHNKVETSAL
jgi:polyphosphate glucokinase